MQDTFCGSQLQIPDPLERHTVGVLNNVHALNNDGFDDIIVGPHPVSVLSGHDGSLLMTMENDDGQIRSVGSAGDIDGDGYGDVVIGAPGHTANPDYQGVSYPTDFGGYVEVRSGRDGSTLLRVEGNVHGEAGTFCGGGELLGWDVAGLEDVDGDDVPDIAFSVLGAVDEECRHGEVRILSGATGSVVRTVQAPDTTFYIFGYSVVAAGDVDRDEVPDFTVTASRLTNGYASQGGAYTFSGATGSVIHTESAFTQPGYGTEIVYGYSAAGAGDFDGDGWDDVVIGNPPHELDLGPGCGQALVYSGRTGAILHDELGFSSWDYLGYAVAGVGDLDQDGFDDIAVGAPAANNFTSSLLPGWRIIHGRASTSCGDIDCPDFLNSGSAVKGIYLSPYLHGIAEEGGDLGKWGLALHGGNGQPAGLCLLYYGITALSPPLPALGINFYLLPTGTAQFIVNGPSGAFAIHASLSSALIGLDLLFQSVFVESVDPLVLSSSPLLEIIW